MGRLWLGAVERGQNCQGRGVKDLGGEVVFLDGLNAIRVMLRAV